MKITVEQYNVLTAEQKKLWKKEGDEYALVGDTEIAAEARRAKEREKQRADEAETKLAELTTRLETLEGTDAKKRGDIQAIEKSWSDKLEAAKKTSEKSISTLKSQLEKVMIDNAINGIASEIFTNPKRDSRLLSDRVYVDYEGDAPVVRVKDTEGKPSALTLEDLKKETVDNKDYKDILIGSKASGSGGTGGGSGGGASKQPKDYSEAERIELYRTNPGKFRELFPSN